jgi:uncharacterized protein YbcV (DUF1398 family)
MSNAVSTLQAAQEHALAIRPKAGGFPVLAEVLRRAGVRRNEWSLPSAQSLYLTGAGAVVQQGEPLLTGTAEVSSFNRDAVITALRTDQAGDSTLPEFLEAIWHAGVIRYVVDLDARTVTYYGSTGENYVESYHHVQVDHLQRT